MPLSYVGPAPVASDDITRQSDLTATLTEARKHGRRFTTVGAYTATSADLGGFIKTGFDVTIPAFTAGDDLARIDIKNTSGSQIALIAGTNVTFDGDANIAAGKTVTVVLDTTGAGTVCDVIGGVA